MRQTLSIGKLKVGLRWKEESLVLVPIFLVLNIWNSSTYIGGFWIHPRALTGLIKHVKVI